MMAAARDKSLMRNLGEFFGHIAKAVRSDPGKKKVVKKEVEEKEEGDVVVRRTTIEEIEFKDRPADEE